VSIAEAGHDASIQREWVGPTLDRVGMTVRAAKVAATVGRKCIITDPGRFLAIRTPLGEKFLGKAFRIARIGKPCGLEESPAVSRKALRSRRKPCGVKRGRKRGAGWWGEPLERRCGSDNLLRAGNRDRP
jgi:hypothetical protein